jgi:hypothetical protein
VGEVAAANALTLNAPRSGGALSFRKSPEVRLYKKMERLGIE